MLSGAEFSPHAEIIMITQRVETLSGPDNVTSREALSRLNFKKIKFHGGRVGALAIYILMAIHKRTDVGGPGGV